MKPKSMCSCWWHWNSVSPGFVGNEVDFGLLVAAKHDHVFQDSGCGLSQQAREFKAVPMKVDGMG